MPYIPKKVKIINYRRESSDTFTIKVKFKHFHRPGQFMLIGLPGIGEAPVSIASYSDEYMEFNIRKVGNVTRAISKLKKNSTIFIRGPYGKGYPMHHFKGDNIIMIGGGCGVAPLKGVIEYVNKYRVDFNDIIMFLGFRSPEEILFSRNLEDWKKNYNVFMSVDKNPGNTCFKGKVGFVTDMLKEEHINNQGSVVFICGPPIMIKNSIDILIQKGFNEQQIFISTERLMYCGIGVCGHCMIHGKYTCVDGPVFRYDEISAFKND
jgi:anaerobic sulfite reductase subunit B